MLDKEILLKNEYEINKLIVKMYKLMLFMGPLAIFLKAVGLFISEWIHVLILSSVFMIICALPIIVAHNNMESRRIKGFSVFGMLILSATAYSFAFVNTVFLWIVPILISGLYFSKRLIWISIGTTIPLMVVGEIIAEKTGQEFLAGVEWIPLHIAIFLMQFFILGYLFILLVNRALDMLYSSQALFENMENIFTKNENTSIHIEKLLERLSLNMEESDNTLKYISSDITLISGNAEDFLEDIKYTGNKSRDISKEIGFIYDNSDIIMKRAEEASKTIEKNGISLEEAIREIKTIEVSSEKSREAVNNLVEKTREISESLELITKIQKETKLLAVNSSIEAARAGEIGKGFGVVASSINELALKSAEYTQRIKDKLAAVFGESEKAIKLINESFETVSKGIEAIMFLKENFVMMIENQKIIISSVEKMKEEVSGLKDNGVGIEEKMNELIEANNIVVERIIAVTGSVEELSATFEQNIVYIKEISEKSAELEKRQL